MSIRASHRHCVVLVLAALVPAVAHATAAVSVIPVARDSMLAPDGNGHFSTYSSYGEPVINDAGAVAFTGRFAGSFFGTLEDDYLVRATTSGTRVLLARQNQALPDVAGTFGNLHVPSPRQYAMNDSGRVVFIAPRLGTPGGSADNSAVYSIKDPTLFWVHARRGDTPPYTSTTFNGFFPPTINDQPPAAVSFFTSHGSSSAPVTLYTSRLGLLSPISWLSQAAPDGEDGDGMNGSLSVFTFAGTGEPAALRPNASEVALAAHLAGTTNASIDDDGVFRASPDGFVDLARGNQSAPGGGRYQEFSQGPVYNANGVAAFQSNLKPVPSAGEVIALDWPYGGDLAAYTGQPAADGNGTFTSLFPPSLNNHEAVAFYVRLAGTSGGGFDDEAIYKGDSTLLVVPPIEDQIAREGASVPEGGGTFGALGTAPAINDAGQVAFTASLRGTPGGSADDRGLYLWDPAQGLVKLLREGDVIDGRTVLAFSALVARNFGGLRGLNDAGEVVARVDFVQPGGDGIYVFRLEPALDAPPPPPVSGRVSLRVQPNPATSGAVEVRWSAPEGGHATVRVLDAAGRRVRELFDGASDAARARWDLTDARRTRVAPGIYIVLLETGGERRARRVVVTR